MSDLISRQAAIDAFTCDGSFFVYGADVCKAIVSRIKQIPAAQPEPLTDAEKRIFLAAMGREEKVCEEMDRNPVREPYDSLMHICKEIRRKVKGALWI